jgi:hypothetical protein
VLHLDQQAVTDNVPFFLVDHVSFVNCAFHLSTS